MERKIFALLEFEFRIFCLISYCTWVGCNMDTNTLIQMKGS